MWVFFLKNCSFLFYQLIHELVNVLRESIIGFLSFTYQSDKVIMTVRIFQYVCVYIYIHTLSKTNINWNETIYRTYLHLFSN